MLNIGFFMTRLILIVKFPITFYIAKRQRELPGLGPLIIIPGGILGKNPGGGMFIPGGGPPGWPGGGTEKEAMCPITRTSSKYS